MTTQEKLIAIYEQAEKRLFAIIQRKGAFASSSMYERTLLRQIQEELKRLKVQSAKTVSELVIENYQASLDSLVQDLQAMGVPIDVDTTPAQLAMSRLNTRQIEMIARNVSTDFNGAIDAISRRTQDVIRNVTLEATAQKLSTGQTIQQMQKSLTEIFKAQNIMSVQYANGVNMPIKKYAEMTARSTTAEAQNKAQTTQGKEWGYDLVKMTTHSPTCPTCAMYQGRVYALTKEAANGKYKTRDGTVLHFPYLYETAFVRGYDTIHPNCRHRISIFPPQAYTSDELKAYSAKSTAPFEDTRSDRERKKYAEQQAEKRRRNEERKQYERIRAALPDTAPKSYAGFVHMKHTNFQKYQELMEDYRYVTRVAKAQNDGIIKERQFNSKADPMYEVTGSAFKSNPKEVQKMIDTLEKWGVQLSYGSSTLGYGCTRRGKPGGLSITKEASYSAWCHEFQHAKDDKDAGWNGLEVLWTDQHERERREKRAYAIEIALAKKAGREDIVKRLEANLNEELENIRRSFEKYS